MSIVRNNTAIKSTLYCNQSLPFKRQAAMDEAAQEKLYLILQK